MIRFQQTAYAVAIHPARVGERWQSGAAYARVPSPHNAALMLRSAWCRAECCGGWLATMSFAVGAKTVWESAVTGGWRRPENS